MNLHMVKSRLAKLTTGAGTWPAIWMLGENYETNTWPGCGEIDIMEYKGVNP
jgi:beta-glucanase (GH16 family)